MQPPIHHHCLQSSFTRVAAWLIWLSMLSAACGPSLGYRYPTAGMPSPLPSRTPTATAAQPPTPGGPTHRLTMYNRFEYEIFVFLDDGFPLRIKPGRSGAFQNLPAGSHILVYCRQKERAECSREAKILVDADIVLTAGEEPPAVTAAGLPSPTPNEALTGTTFYSPVLGQPTLGGMTPTTPPTAESNMTAGPSPSGPTDPATVTALAPTLAAIAPTLTALALHPPTPPPTATLLPPHLRTAMVTVHNRYNRPLGVSIGGRFLMTVPAHHYMYHLGIPLGVHKFQFCAMNSTCTIREVEVYDDIVLYIGN